MKHFTNQSKLEMTHCHSPSQEVISRSGSISIRSLGLGKDGKLSSAGVMIHLQRDGLALLMGSFYIPTGIFAVLAMTSYVINPDAVGYVSN